VVSKGNLASRKADLAPKVAEIQKEASQENSKDLTLASLIAKFLQPLTKAVTEAEACRENLVEYSD
jgi:hypothetical protein